MDPDNWDNEQSVEQPDGARTDEVEVRNPSNDVEEDFEFDFSDTITVQRGNGLDNQPDYKNYFIRRIQKKNSATNSVRETEGEELQRIRFAKEECGTILQKVATTMLMDINNIKFHYTIKSKNGKVKDVVVMNNSTVEENCENFYCETKENSTITVETKPTTKKASRKSKKSEDAFGLLMKAMHSYDVYMVLKKQILQVRKYFVMLKNVRVMVADHQSITLITPGHYICPVCREKKCLKMFNQKTAMIAHIRGHFVTTNSAKYDVMIRRYEFFEKNRWDQMYPGSSTEELISKMDEEHDVDGTSLKLPDEPAIFIPHAGQMFAGAFLALDEIRLQKLADWDPTALEGIERRNSDTSSVMQSEEDEGVDSRTGTDTSSELRKNTDDQLDLTNNSESD